jgi:hypothetical protein
MLDTIRGLSRTLKLKELVIANFVPEETCRQIERRSTWVEDEDGDGWAVPKVELAGAALRRHSAGRRWVA